MDVKKLNDYTWEIPKQGGMQVSARIFATERLMGKIKQDRTLQQAMNVAHLKGILKHAFVMPDAHEGYGFPIGGVAAFDRDEGIISPGGIGYDVNCLTEDAKVMTADGTRRISRFLKAVPLATVGNGKLTAVEPSHFMRFTPKNRVVKVKTETGNVLSATEDHPFLAQEGMVAIGKLAEGSLVATAEDEKIVWQKIDEMMETKYDGYVYDFTVPKTHNFVANNFIVSNCGVRLLRTDFRISDILPKRTALLNELFSQVPSGVGRGGITKLTKDELLEILAKGSEWSLEHGYGTKPDLEATEEYGRMKQAEPSLVSERALARGKPQLGTLGAGNHFLEMQKVDEIYDEKTAAAFGITEKDQVTVMVHCGSRGFGHQVASDYITKMEKKYGWEHLPDRELVNAPLQSELGQEYYRAMCAGVNYAFANRQMIVHWIRNSFRKVMGSSEGMDQVYDVCHNIAKLEKHKVDGSMKEVCIHRKGATRAFGPGREEIPERYREVGQPIFIPGSMGTASYILVGTATAEDISFGSTAHGAGRELSRAAAIRQFKGEKIARELLERGIEVKSASYRGIAEEAPGAYKSIDEVAKTSDGVQIGRKVVRLVPVGVVKG